MLFFMLFCVFFGVFISVFIFMLIGMFVFVFTFVLIDMLSFVFILVLFFVLLCVFFGVLIRLFLLVLLFLQLGLGCRPQVLFLMPLMFMVTAAVTVFSMVMLMAAAMTFFMTVMMAAAPWNVGELAFQQLLHGRCHIALGPCVNLNAQLGQARSGTFSHAAADYRIHALLLQKSSQGPVAMTLSVQKPLIRNLPLFHRYQFKLGAFAKMLKNLSFCKRNCNFHIFCLLSQKKTSAVYTARPLLQMVAHFGQKVETIQITSTLRRNIFRYRWQ